jgi:hypothetical protein
LLGERSRCIYKVAPNAKFGQKRAENASGLEEYVFRIWTQSRPLVTPFGAFFDRSLRLLYHPAAVRAGYGAVQALVRGNSGFP